MQLPYGLPDHIPCSRCGYDLQSLPKDSLCPECGYPIAKSVRGDLFRFADPTWVKKLGHGTYLVGLGLLAYVASLLTIAFGPSVETWRDLTHFAAASFFTIGAFLLSAVDPGQGVGGEQNRSIPILRGAAPASFVTNPDFAGFFSRLLPSWSVSTFSVLLIAHFLSLIALIAVFFRLSELAPRIPQKGAWHIRFYSVTVGGGYLALQMLAILCCWLLHRNSTDMLMVMASIQGFYIMIFSYPSLRMLNQLSIAFKRAAAAGALQDVSSLPESSTVEEETRSSCRMLLT